MGKQGPCYHCGVTSTPLWRNGPPEKPVLCNACGSRWRTKGTLANYTPLHARADTDYENHAVSRVKSISINNNKEAKLLKERTAYHVVGAVPDYDQGYGKVLDEDTSNKSSSESAISNYERCAPFGSMDMNELTGSLQLNGWDPLVPSKKRTCFNRAKPKSSSVEKLTKDLFNVLQQQQLSCFSGSSEDDLIFESETPMVSVEIVHGSILIRHPSSVVQDEESEASSVTVENKLFSGNEAYSDSTNHYLQEVVGMSSCTAGKSKNSTGQWMRQRQLDKDELQHEVVHILENPNSPLCNIDLNDILSFEEFSSQLSNEEQQQLLKYLPPIDLIDRPDSLRNMFASCQFKENISSFQKGVAEGVFDLSLDETKTEDCKTLKRLILSNLSTSKWVQHYHKIQGWQSKNGTCPVKMASNVVAPTNLVSLKRLHDSLAQKFREAKTIRSPKRMTKKDTYEKSELAYNDGCCFSPRRILVLPTDSSSIIMNSLNFVDQSSDQDVLLDVPSNGSFPQAELLTDFKLLPTSNH